MRLNKPVRDIVILLVIIVAGGAAYWWYTPHYPRRPAFTMTGLDGAKHSIADYDGQVVLLNFSATWCIPCREEIPMLVQAQTELGAQGLQIIGIAIDKRKPTAAFAQRYEINYPVLVSRDDGARLQDKFTTLMDTAAAMLPYSVVIDRQGRVRADILGKLDRARLNKLVLPLLGGAPGAASD